MTALTHPTAGEERSLSGARLWAVRGVWLAVAAASLAVAVAGFEVFLSGDRPLVDTQGPLALQPELARQLEFRLFDLALIKGAQTAMHLGGIALFSTAGVVIFWRRSRDWVVALSSATLLLVGVALFVPSHLLATTRPAWNDIVPLLGVFDATPEFWRSLAGVAVLMFALLFPDGRFVPAWTRWFAAAFLVEVVLWALFPGLTVFDVSEWPSSVEPAWTLGLALVAVYAQLYRFIRVSDTETRKQTRLVMISLTAVVGSFVLIWVLDPSLSGSVDFGLVLVTDRTQAIYDLNILGMLTVGVLLFPISIGVSVARYRLWDMDLIINRALVYGTLTGIIGGALLAAVVLVGGVVENTVGQGIGIGMSAVLMLALFQPLRTRVQSGIDRRFYPHKYDAERTLDALAERIRDQVDLEVLRSEVESTVTTTLQPTTTRLSLPALDDSYEADHRLLDPIYLAEANRPIATTSELLPAEAAAAFTMRGIELVAPLVSHGELVGVLELGPRPAARGYSALDQQLLRRLATQAAPVIRYGELVTREAEERAARQGYEKELELAEQIQRDLLPRQLPELDGWELGARYQPSRQVSGDLYDFIKLQDGKLGVVIADVTDKGAPAAMVMATCRTLLRAASTGENQRSPGEVLALVNDLLLPDIPQNMFVTCFYAELDPATGRVTFANAGQNLPLMRSVDQVTELMARGMPLGLMPEMTYEENEVVVSPGDSLLFYSDGLVEAHDPHGEMFGKDRVIDRVRNHPGGPALLDYLVESLIGFAGEDGAREDDVTLVTIKRLGGGTADDRELRVIVEFSAPSEQGGEREVVSRLEADLADLSLSARMMERLKTAVAEATMNAMEHGNGYDPNLQVEIKVLASATHIEVHITDEGEGPPILSAEEPDLGAKLAGEQSPRGWGIFLIKNMVDDLRVTDADGRHRLELVMDREQED